MHDRSKKEKLQSVTEERNNAMKRYLQLRTPMNNSKSVFQATTYTQPEKVLMLFVYKTMKKCFDVHKPAMLFVYKTVKKHLDKPVTEH